MLKRGISMQINTNNRTNQSFGGIKLMGGAEDTLRKVLKPADWIQLDKIAKEQEKNTVDVYLFGHNGGKLMGRIIPNNSNFKDKDYYQLPFFESTIKFIDKMAKKANIVKEKIDKLPAVNIDEIVGRLSKES